MIRTLRCWALRVWTMCCGSSRGRCFAGPTTLAMILACRQLLAVLLSVALYGHDLPLECFGYAALVFAAVVCWVEQSDRTHFEFLTPCATRVCVCLGALEENQRAQATPPLSPLTLWSS